MSDPEIPRWLSWGREIQALSQTGRHYARDDFDLQRYTRLSEIAVEIIGEYSGLDVTSLTEAFKAQTGYATPRVDVRSAVFRGGKLLMVRERADGGWTLPGGWADVGDAPQASAPTSATSRMYLPPLPTQTGKQSSIDFND